MTTVAALHDVSLSLGGKPLLAGLGLQVHDGDHIGVVGPNGSGKSSLLRLLAGELEPDGGRITKVEGVRVGFLPQEIAQFPNQPLLTFVHDSIAERPLVRKELERSESRLATLQSARADEAELVQAASDVAALHERMAALDAQFSAHEAKQILHGLGFSQSDHNRPLSELSGGWKMRAVLASLLFQKPGLLLLDEPTNHLDMPSVAWFSKFLRAYDRALFLVSHDREFLNEQVNRIVSFEPEGVRTFRGDYDGYLKQRDEERHVLQNRAKNVERERAHLEQFVRRFRAKASKAAQVQSRVRMLEKMETVELYRSAPETRFSFPPTVRGPRLPLRVEELSKSFGNRAVFERVNLAVERGDRVAIVGPNGAGKTTLLKILSGEIDPTEGRVHLPGLSEVRYFAQHHAEALNVHDTVFQEVMRSSDGSSAERVRAVLGALLFDELGVQKRVSVLSGGERARVALAKILVRPGNVLLMDEPTNHLDLQTTEALTDALTTIDGTLLFVSHNRGFIRQLATKLWVVHDGTVESYPGNLDDYIWSCQERDIAPATEAVVSSEKQKKNRSSRKDRRRRDAELRAEQNRELKPLERRVKALEKRIAELEEAVAQHTDDLGNPELYDDAVKRDTVIQEMQAAQAELERCFEEWSEMHEKLERLRASFDA